VKPNPIDFDRVFIEFRRLGDTGNVAVIVTVAVVVLCYFIVLVIVRRTDKEDARNVSTFTEVPYTGYNQCVQLISKFRPCVHT